MGKQATVTAKIPTELKESLKRLGVNVSGLIRDALGQKAEQLEKQRLRELAEEASEILQKIPAKELVESIRVSREVQ